MMLVGELMNSGPSILCCNGKETIRQVIERMLKNQCSSIILTDNDNMENRKALAIITMTDVLRWSLKHDLGMSVGQILDTRTPVAMVDTDTSIVDAARLMVYKHVHHLVVLATERPNRLQGIISAHTIAEEMASKVSAWPFPKDYLKEHVCQYQNVDTEQGA